MNDSIYLSIQNSPRFKELVKKENDSPGFSRRSCSVYMPPLFY